MPTLAPQNDRNGRSSTTTSPSSCNPPLTCYWDEILISFWRLLTPPGMAPSAAPWRHWRKATFYATRGRRVPTVPPTHHTTHGATRIDRFYLSGDFLVQKKCIATVAAAFTHHFAAVLRLSWSTPVIRRGRGTWKMKCDIIISDHVMETLKQFWIRWKRQHQ